jgi:1,4-alpha-glucan branching enzyme
MRKRHSVRSLTGRLNEPGQPQAKDIDVFNMRKSKSKQLSPNGSSSASVHLEYTNPTAAAVCVAGTFNDWRPAAAPMVAVGDGRWIKELALPPGLYEYRIVADGEWMADPLARETNPNPFGGLNSVLKVESCA